MRNTLLLSEIFPPKTGGSGRWFHEIYSRLGREEFRLMVGDDPQAAAFDLTHDLSLTRHPLSMPTRGIRSLRNLKQYVSMARLVNRVVRREGITAIHAARNLPEGFVASLVKRWRGTPYLCYVHGEDVAVSATSRELACMTRRVLKLATAAIANSENTRRMLLDEWKMPPEKVWLLHPGVDTNRFVPATRDEAVRATLGWSGRTVLLTVGRLQRRKGHDHLIAALPAIRQKHPGILYAILGSGEEQPRLVELAAKHGVTDCVQFLGEVPDATLMQCYQQCDLFVLPNRTIGRDAEGFGMVLLEAQACGRAVVAGNSGGTAETMILGDPHLETGRIIDCTTPETIAPPLIELLNDPPHLSAMGTRGRQHVCDRFDWQALSRQAAEMFSRVGK